VNCGHNSWGSHNCEHGEDVSVSCNRQYAGIITNKRFKVVYSESNNQESIERAQISDIAKLLKFRLMYIELWLHIKSKKCDKGFAKILMFYFM